MISFLNTCTEINIITYKLVEDVRLAMWQNSKLELVSYTSFSCYFSDLYENVEVALEKLKTGQPIFIVEHRDHHLILSQLFLSSVTFCQEYTPNKIFGTI